MNHLSAIQHWLRSGALMGLVVPSTDEFLSEFSPPANRRLEWATGFHGSTGVAIILRTSAALFVDGRYRLQALTDTQGTNLDIQPATLAARRGWLQRSLGVGGRLALDPSLHPSTEVAEWESLAADLGFEIELLGDNPIDSLWSGERPPLHQPLIRDYDVRHAGESYQAKCERLIEHVRSAGLQALLLADAEDVSWLLNVRADAAATKTRVGEWHIVPSCTSRALVKKDGHVSWFIDRARLTSAVVARQDGALSIEPPDQLATALQDLARQGPVGADPQRTPADLAAILGSQLRPDDTAARQRWRKHHAELQSAREVHVIDAAAVIRFIAALTQRVPQDTVTEIEAAQMLDSLRAEHSAYRGPSMPFMCAGGPSGAQPHYVPRPELCRRLNDHPIFWMDSGAQYLGGTTDNTVTFALAPPEPKHVHAHTLVLKGNIALASARFPVGTSAFRLDTIARMALWREGMDYAHGTSHGVGNYLNIHEGPVIRPEPRPISTLPLEAGMIVTNEPGYYAEADFGIRIETHMIVTASAYPNFLEFETISRLPIDPTLVDFELLSSAERHWLADYHRLILRDVEPLLDAADAAWLRALVVKFVQASVAPERGGTA